MPEKPSRSSCGNDRLPGPLAGQVFPPGRFVKKAGQVDHGVIVDGHHHVRVLNVMDPRDVLVTDALDAVGAETVLQQGRALQRFTGNDLAVGEELFHVIAAGDRPGRAGGGGHAAVMVLGSHDLFEHFFHGMTGHFIVPQVIAKLLELVEDHQVLSRLAQFPALVKDLFHVRLGAGRLDDFTGDLLQPLEALLAHAFRQDGDGGTAQQGRVVGAAAAEVTGRWPDSLLCGRVELARHQSRHQAAKGRPNLVRPRGEPLAHQHHDARRHPGQAGRQFEIVDPAEPTAAFLGLIFPGDAEQVARRHVPQSDLGQFFLHPGRDFGWVFHLGIGWDDDILLAGALDGAFAAVFDNG